ncbi:hypothetical protein RclHR1_00750024 [Rhizophagus clarus]|uniref:F-box domain containing protein n=1 Tax=Rhizophagus clarus TaxID=94130 RepID=A0A2Z6SCE7_9GLOM|nr:hypothetical protein RclHR1_00750024 [Rhizophagus clarus]GES85846.1 F-box domain containing protein [Rhizophagus clarus]
MSYQKPKLDIAQQNTYGPIHKRSKQSHIAQKKTDYVKENKRDFVKIFSDELNLHVFKYLSAADLSICARVSRHWWRLTNDRQLWKDLFLSRFKAPKRPNLTYRLESLQMIPSQINSIPKSQMLLDETCNNMVDEEDWKNIYRVSHNWQTGNCRVIDFKPYVSLNKDQKQDVSSSSSSASHEESLMTRDTSSPINFFTRFHTNPSANINSNPLVQFTRHVILTASSSGINDTNSIPEIYLWRAGKQNEHIDTLRSGVLHKAITAQKSKFPITITCLKLDSNEGKDDTETHKLVAGYSNGGFTIWEIDSLERSNNDVGKWRHREIYTLPMISSHRMPYTRSQLIACALHFPVLVTCTEDFELSIYFIDCKSDANTLSSDEKLIEQVECRLVHQLRSFVCWAPVEISVECITGSSQYTSINYDTQDSWKAVVAYSVPLYGGGWTVGIQEIKFSATRLISTRHCSSLPSFIPILSENNFTDDIEQFSFAPITTITYNNGQLVTAHCDNTLQVYYVLEQGTKLECRHKCTLYGHTGSVMSVALDEHGKLITGSMDHSIKIWDLGWNLVKNNERRKSKDYDNDVKDINYHHNLYRDTEFSTVGITAKRKKHGECIVTLSDSSNNIGEFEKYNNFGIKWVGFDEGRIVSVCGGTTVKKNLQSNTKNNCSRKRPIGPPPGWVGLSSTEAQVDSQSNNTEDIGIVKVWSFCDE